MNTKDWTISAIITIVGGLFVAVVGGLLLHAILNKLNKKTPTNKINNKEKAQNIPTEIKQSKKTKKYWKNKKCRLMGHTACIRLETHLHMGQDAGQQAQ